MSLTLSKHAVILAKARTQLIRWRPLRGHFINWILGYPSMTALACNIRL